MSELMNVNTARTHIRWHLLASASTAAVLLSTVASANAGDDADRPTVWIELGGQLERISGGEEPFTPPFLSTIPSFIQDSPLHVERPARYGTGAEGKISFEPEGSDWIFSASLRYGRSVAKRHVHEQLKTPQFTGPSGYHFQKYFVNFSDTKVRNEENHGIVDFQAGKDVGLGAFGRNGKSTFSLGVRYAQFHSRANSALKLVPDANYPTTFYQFASSLYQTPKHHTYVASAIVSHNFRGIGPSISWDASADIVGSPETAEISFNWGVNAAVLFGRQKAETHHQSTVGYYSFVLGRGRYLTSVHRPPVDRARSRSVTVPNIGGFAGLSFRYSNAKVSFGYRADMFFGAMDGGVDTRKTYDRDFYGPFATISIGLGR